MREKTKVGDIVLIPFPFSDLSGVKVRPAVVLQHDREDVLVVFITSVEPEGKSIKLNKNDLNALKTNSFIRYTKINSIDSSLIHGSIGELSKQELSILKSRIKVFLNI